MKGKEKSNEARVKEKEKKKSVTERDEEGREMRGKERRG